MGCARFGTHGAGLGCWCRGAVFGILADTGPFLTGRGGALRVDSRVRGECAPSCSTALVVVLEGRGLRGRECAPSWSALRVAGGRSGVSRRVVPR